MIQRLILTVILLAGASPAFAQRLPSTAVPQHYDLSVAPDLAAATFRGTEAIRVSIPAPTKTIVLNAAEITFDTVTIDASGRSQPATVTLDPKQEQATFTVPQALPRGDATIHIRYQGILNNQLRGLYLSKGKQRRYAVSQLEATDARRMFPCFDEPALKATFSLTAVIDKGDIAISNGAVASDEPGPDAGTHTIRFTTTPKMSTYLVALAVGDFVCREGSADGTPIRVCATPDKKDLTGVALEAAETILKYYDHYYAVPYPFKKLDIVAVPDFAAGAMENTGAIFYRETLLLAEPRNASLDVKKSIAAVLAHEMAHQWFGDLVTMQWWDDIWLNEGFASWMATKPLKDWKPEWHSELEEVQANQEALRLDALQATRPVRARASTPAEISELFDAIAYQKGAAVLRMIESYLGEDAFRAGVNAYVQRFKYSNARAEDFWNTLAESSGKPVDRIMASFVDQPGAPLVSAAIQCKQGGATVELSQQRFQLEAARAPKASSEQVWTIPVCLHLPDGSTKCEVLESKQGSVTVPSCPAWVVANAGGRGYYRVAYPAAGVSALSKHAESLPAAERIALLGDEWSLVRAARHEIGTFLDLAAGFGGERTAAVMETLEQTLRAIADDLTTDASRADYERWIQKRFGSALEDVGWTAEAGEAPERAALRATLVRLLGESGRDPAVMKKARELASALLTDTNAVEPTLRSTVVNIAAIDGDAALYEKYLAHAKDAVVPEERHRYMTGLTKFEDPALVQRTFDLVLSPDVRSQDAKLMIASLLGNPAGRKLTWNLLRDHWSGVQAKTGEFVGNTVIVRALSNFCGDEQAGEIRTFFAAHPVRDADRTLQQTIERVTTCGAIAKAQGPALTQWLETGSGRTAARVPTLEQRLR
jgi:aminopeptidase N